MYDQKKKLMKFLLIFLFISSTLIYDSYQELCSLIYCISRSVKGKIAQSFEERSCECNHLILNGLCLKPIRCCSIVHSWKLCPGVLPRNRCYVCLLHFEKNDCQPLLYLLCCLATAIASPEKITFSCFLHFFSLIFCTFKLKRRLQACPESPRINSCLKVEYTFSSVCLNRGFGLQCSAK